MRSQSGLTQGELATKVGVSQKTLSSWETGRTDPSIEETIKLCNALNCTMEALTGTRLRSKGEISYDDILVKLCDLDMKRLYELREVIDSHIKRHKEIEEMEKQKADAIKRIAAYEAEIQKLKEKLKGVE
jgi:DNA-binding XRE family transcriptional regulator